MSPALAAHTRPAHIRPAHIRPAIGPAAGMRPAGARISQAERVSLAERISPAVVNWRTFSDSRREIRKTCRGSGGHDRWYSELDENDTGAADDHGDRCCPFDQWITFDE
jgi:hypothetical protein